MYMLRGLLAFSQNVQHFEYEKKQGEKLKFSKGLLGPQGINRQSRSENLQNWRKSGYQIQ